MTFNLKYPLLCRVGTIMGDEKVARECYLNNLETSRQELALVDNHSFECPNADFEGCDPKLGAEMERPTAIEHLKEVQIGPHVHQVTNIGSSLFAREKWELFDRLR